MRRVRGAGNVVEEERLARISLVDPVHPVNGVVGHGGDEVPGSRRLALEGIDLGGVAEEVRLPLVGVTANEPVEVIEAHADGPLVERADLRWPAKAGVLWSLPNQEVAKPFSLRMRPMVALSLAMMLL